MQVKQAVSVCGSQNGHEGGVEQQEVLEKLQKRKRHFILEQLQPALDQGGR